MTPHKTAGRRGRIWVMRRSRVEYKGGVAAACAKCAARNAHDEVTPEDSYGGGGRAGTELGVSWCVDVKTDRVQNPGLYQ